MTSYARMIATAAFAIFSMSAFNLYGEGAEKPMSGAKPLDSSFVEPAASVFAVPAGAFSEAQAMPYPRARNLGVPRFELFVGYSYVNAALGFDSDNRLVWLNGGSTSLAYNVNRTLGLVGDFGAYTNSEVRFSGGSTSTVKVDKANTAVMTYLFGPRFSFRSRERVTPFGQALFGGVHANQVTLANCTVNCTLLPSENRFAMTAGVGLDIRVHRHFAIRLVQAEYLMTRFTNYNTGAIGTQNDMRLSAGIVFRFGGRDGPSLPPQQPLAYSCSVTPTSVFIGEPIAVSGTALNLDPAKTDVYTWSADGGRIDGSSYTARIDTKDTVPGAYTLKGHVSQGARPSDNADCSAPYAVKAYEPLTVSCSANPATLISGDPSTITAIGVSPQNRPLTYSYSSSAGTVNGVGPTAILSTGGAPVGTIIVTCNIADDKGQTASGTTSVTFAAPVAAPKPLTSDLCSVHFDRDVRRPSRVDNEGKACLDGVALNLQQNSNANLAIVGNATSSEKNSHARAAERAVNTKAYLVNEKGIDSSRIAVYTGSQDSKIVSITLIPAEATFEATGDTPVR